MVGVRWLIIAQIIVRVRKLSKYAGPHFAAAEPFGYNPI